MNGIINLLSNNGYIIVNKEIIKKLGLHEAIIIGELCSEYIHWEKAGKLDDNYFYSTRENIEENTGLSAYQQREPLKRLINIGVVLEKNKGMPLQKWYSLNSELLYEILCGKIGFTTSSEETAHQEVKKLDNNEFYCDMTGFTTSSEETAHQEVKKLDNNEFNWVSTGFTTSSKETTHQEVKKLDDKMSRNLTSSSEETAHHDVKKLEINNNKNNNKINNNNNNNIYIYNNKKIKIKDKVYLTQKEYNDLINKYGKDRIDRLITRLDLYKKSTGKNYKDDYSTILLWINSNDDKESTKDTEESEWIKAAKEKFGKDLSGIYANFKI